MTTDKTAKQFKYKIPESSFDYVITNMILDRIIDDSLFIYRFLEVLICYDTRNNTYRLSSPIVENLTEFPLS